MRRAHLGTRTEVGGLLRRQGICRERAPKREGAARTELPPTQFIRDMSLSS